MTKCFWQLIAQRFRLDGMKDIPTSLAYLTPGSGANKTEPLLAVGDDNGDVFILRFLKPTQSLFKKREVDDIQQIYWRVRRLKFYVPLDRLYFFTSIQIRSCTCKLEWFRSPFYQGRTNHLCYRSTSREHCTEWSHAASLLTSPCPFVTSAVNSPPRLPCRQLPSVLHL